MSREHGDSMRAADHANPGAAVLLALLASPAIGVDVAPAWTARWISVPGAPAFDYGVYHFRRTFDLPREAADVPRPRHRRQPLSALRQRRARVLGPARGDLYHWRYETVDLAPHLEAGPERAGRGRVELRRARAPGPGHVPDRLPAAGRRRGREGAEHGQDWKAIRNEAYAPVPIVPAEIHYQYYVAGPGDRVDAAAYPWGWEQPDFDDRSGSPRSRAPSAARATPSTRPAAGCSSRATIPAMEETPMRFARVRRADGDHGSRRLPATRRGASSSRAHRRRPCSSTRTT